MRQGNSHFDDPTSAGDRAGPLGEGSPSTANRAFGLLTGAFSWFFLGVSFAILTQTLLGRIVAGSYAMEWKVFRRMNFYTAFVAYSYWTPFPQVTEQGPLSQRPHCPSTFLTAGVKLAPILTATFMGVFRTGHFSSLPVHSLGLPLVGPLGQSLPLPCLGGLSQDRMLRNGCVNGILKTRFLHPCPTSIGLPSRR